MWLKPLFLMLVASTYALGEWPNLMRLAAGFVIVGPLLWGGLYTINALTDVRDDARHPVKCLRPFPSGRLDPRLGAWVSGAAIVLAVALSWRFGWRFAVCVLLMMAKQLAYTLPPLRLKRRYAWDVVSGSLGNSTLRFAAGWFLVSNRWPLPLLLLVFAECVQLAGFLVNRLFTNYSMGLETQLHYDSTTTRVPTPLIQRAIAGCWAVGLACLLLIMLNGQLQIAPAWLGQLPWQSLLVLALLALALPFFQRAMARADQLSYRDSQLCYDLPLAYMFVLSVILSFIITTYS
jgi:4-hydroxybenzoate polyprenyltransferase